LIVINRSSSGDCIFDFTYTKTTALIKGKRTKVVSYSGFSPDSGKSFLLAFWQIKGATDSEISSELNLFGLELAFGDC
jgi:hypothetical protein